MPNSFLFDACWLEFSLGWICGAKLHILSQSEGLLIYYFLEIQRSKGSGTTLLTKDLLVT